MANEKTILLSGSEQEVKISGQNCDIRNDTVDIIYASRRSPVVAGEDGVISIPAGQAVKLLDTGGTVYLLGTGSVMLCGNDYAEQVFKVAATSSGEGGGTVDDIARQAASANAAAISQLKTDKADKADIPTSLPADGGNADTVGGHPSYQLETLNDQGNPHGAPYPLICRYDIFGDGRFGLSIDEGDSGYEFETRTDYATECHLLDGKTADVMLSFASDEATYDCNTLFDAGIYAIRPGINTPTEDGYGVLLVLPYRHATGNIIPDFAVQIFIPNGDDPNNTSMWYRTSKSETFDEWREVISSHNADRFATKEELNTLAEKVAALEDKLTTEV